MSLLDPQFKMARARSCIYSLLNRFYAPDPTDSEVKLVLGFLLECVDALPEYFWTEKTSHSFFRSLVAGACESYEDESRDVNFDYRSVLLGSEGNIPFFERYYRNPCARRTCLDSIERIYSASPITALSSYKVPDHLASELHYLHLLSMNEAESILEDRVDSATELRRLEATFLWEHLRSWLPGFSKAVLNATRSKPAASLAQVVDLFTELDAMYLSFLLSKTTDLFTELDSISRSPLVAEKIADGERR